MIGWPITPAIISSYKWIISFFIFFSCWIFFIFIILMSFQISLELWLENGQSLWTDLISNILHLITCLSEMMMSKHHYFRHILSYLKPIHVFVSSLKLYVTLGHASMAYYYLKVSLLAHKTRSIQSSELLSFSENHNRC